jgi:GxxExxY protein
VSWSRARVRPDTWSSRVGVSAAAANAKTTVDLLEAIFQILLSPSSVPFLRPSVGLAFDFLRFLRPFRKKKPQRTCRPVENVSDATLDWEVDMLLYEELSYEIIGAAIAVHGALGPGLLESSYHRCMELELEARGLGFASRVPIDVQFRGVTLASMYEADLVIEDTAILELKAVRNILPVHEAQVLTYMRWLRKPVGYVLNFNCANLTKEGMDRVVRKQWDDS